MSEPTYVISWRALSGPAIGRGTKRLTREEAEKLAAELNAEYPAFHHEALNLNGEPAPA